MDYNYKIINEEFENNKVWIVIFKSLILATLKTKVKFDLNLNLKIFDLPNIRFWLFLNFQIKSSFPNITLIKFNSFYFRLFVPY